MCRFELLGALVLVTQDLIDKFKARKGPRTQSVPQPAVGWRTN